MHALILGLYVLIIVLILLAMYMMQVNVQVSRAGGMSLTKTFSVLIAVLTIVLPTKTSQLVYGIIDKICTIQSFPWLNTILDNLCG
jgi:hypothetical protein